MGPPRVTVPLRRPGRRPVPPRRPAVPIVRWRPVEAPVPPELEQLAAIASELARSGLV